MDQQSRITYIYAETNGIFLDRRWYNRKYSRQISNHQITNHPSHHPHTQGYFIWKSNLFKLFDSLLQYSNTSQVHRKHHRKSAAAPHILDVAFITIAARGSGLQLMIEIRCRISASWLCAVLIFENVHPYKWHERRKTARRNKWHHRRRTNHRPVAGIEAFRYITFFEQKSCWAIEKLVGEVSFDWCRQRPTNWAASNDHNCDPPQLPDRGGERIMYRRLEISTISVFQLISLFLTELLTFFDSYRGLWIDTTRGSTVFSPMKWVSAKLCKPSPSSPTSKKSGIFRVLIWS